jgi:hypothetical protein
VGVCVCARVRAYIDIDVGIDVGTDMDVYGGNYKKHVNGIGAQC